MKLTNSHGPLTKTTVMPINGKILKIFAAESWYKVLGNQGLASLFKWRSQVVLLPLSRQDQSCVPIHLYGLNVEKSFSQNVLKTNG